MTNIDYKKLWFTVCKEKKSLQLENNTLRKNLKYIQKEAEKFERLFKQKVINGQKWKKRNVIIVINYFY